MEFRTSRRVFLRTGAAIGASVVAAGVASRAHAQDEKIAQSAVMYQPGPKDGQKCSGCVNFVAPNACKIVAGNISPEGWCAAYAPKDS
jgi:hypothetical protein